VTCDRFSAGTLVFSTNKTDSHNITGILLKVALDTINLNLNHYNYKQILLCFVVKEEGFECRGEENQNDGVLF